MNQFAPSDAASVKSSENLGGNTAVLEAYEPSNKLLPINKEQRSQQTEALVQSGVLPQMPIDGLWGNEVSPVLKEPTFQPDRSSGDNHHPPSSSETTMANISDETKQHGQKLAELLKSGTNGAKVMDLIKEGMAAGDLKGLILAANIELERGENPLRISAAVSHEKMTYDAEDALTFPAKIEQKNERVEVTVNSLGSLDAVLNFDVKYDPEIKGYGRPHPTPLGQQ
ncbi:hypothetical protein BH11CYA1_BH11CYA1_39690 [soil metagenome]